MSVTYISAELRRKVSERAGAHCEYCLIAEEDTFFGCQVDHIISEKHGGPTEQDNLALACAFCNQFKGTDVGSIHWPDGSFHRFFNPRKDSWADHFQLAADRIEPHTSIKDVTARIFGFNNPERVMERNTLRRFGRYPTPTAS